MTTLDRVSSPMPSPDRDTAWRRAIDAAEPSVRSLAPSVRFRGHGATGPGGRADVEFDASGRGDADGRARADARSDAGAPTTVGLDDPGDPNAVEARFARIVWSAVAEPGDRDAGRLTAAIGTVEAARALCGDAPAERIVRALRETAAGPSSARSASTARFGGTAVGSGCNSGTDVDLADLDAARLTAAIERWRPKADLDRIVRVCVAAANLSVTALIADDDAWPNGIDDLGDASPHVLWVRGVRGLDAVGAITGMAGIAGGGSAHGRSAFGRPAVGIVGSRAATAYGEQVAIDLADGLGARGAVIVSGGAYGIDVAAHRAALAGGYPTVAVLAGGIDRLYPSGNAGVLRRIIDGGGAIVTELPCGQAPTRWRFLQRNRIISALSHGTIVVEAGARSGALNTAGHAAELGRPLGAVPGPVTSAASAGCHRLVREYDATLVTDASEAWELIRPLGGDAAMLPGFDAFDGSGALDTSGGGGGGGGGGFHGLGAEAQRAWDALSPRSTRTVADLAARAGLSESDARGALAELELEGRARLVDGGWRRANRPR